MKKAALGILLAGTTVIIAGCGPGGGTSDPLVIGGKPWTEQYILPHILGQYIEANSEYTVEYEDGLGEVAILTPALEQGDIDMYVEYTGTGMKDVLKEESVPGQSSEEVLEIVRKGYEETLDATWLEPLGFENGYTLAFSKDKGYDAETYSDLAEISKSENMRFGAPHPFYERQGDGFDDLVATYPFEFSATESFDPAIMYEAVNSGEVDVIPAFTTDSRIGLFDLETTEDDQSFFPKYDAVPVVRMETLEEYPELEEVLSGLAGQISEEEMLAMNARVDVDQDQASDVAREFLIEKGLIEE
ncbi:glycine betaine ABC transporter substrate-binding protein [Microbacterium sp. APC 3898]|uniref:Glycine betaine ABC transporter substrate-binding protein n=1 Tax=Planococcus notacanthi TaxID=3035188 RepID=A0ABT7ZM25_9BACL|nr:MULTISPECIES: glycine betaine ABC transporter substrate-binding protein [Terrabacteria group]MDN3428209.1 glycine betaine ABC transporter substrate-binding protein [Planococcus sp. APC 4016]MDN3498253.1 glycine betaine ABC transporter substrate-binding protein [Microbacterium sp. APC 3898]